MKYLICNLKAHKTYYDMLLYKEAIKNLDTKKIELIIAPSTPYLSLFKKDNITLCSQDISLNNELYLTGDTNIEALKSLGVEYAIIGHYERRKYYNENKKQILAKIKTALENNIKVIYCIGETREELERKVEYQVLERDIACILNHIPQEEFKNIIIAYEPNYLIGTNTTYNVMKIEEMINFIKNIVQSYYHTEIKVVFGGNINPDNINKINHIASLDGYILGNASLNPINIKTIIDNIN